MVPVRSWLFILCVPGVLVCATSHFSLAASRILLLSLYFCSLITVCICMYLWAHPNEGSFSCLGVEIRDFLKSNLGSFGCYFVKCSFCPLLSPLLLDFQYVYVDGGMISHRSPRLGSFIFILFLLLFCSSHWIISVDLFSNLLILSFAWSDLLLIPSGWILKF